MWRRILVPHDFSRCAARALELAAALAAESGGSVTIVHVSPLPPNLPRDARVTAPGSSTPIPIDEMLTSGALRELESIATPLRERGLAVRTIATAIDSGTPAAALLRTADELGSDVIVVGTHGRTGLAHLLLGSVAETIIRGARVPVVTVRSRDDEPHRTREETLAEDELMG